MTEEAFIDPQDYIYALKDVRARGDAKEAVVELGKLGRYLKQLLDLSSKRRIAMIFLWGFPQTLGRARFYLVQLPLPENTQVLPLYEFHNSVLLSIRLYSLAPSLQMQVGHNEHFKKTMPSIINISGLG